jgi:hypothetical protein
VRFPDRTIDSAPIDRSARESLPSLNGSISGVRRFVATASNVETAEPFVFCERDRPRTFPVVIAFNHWALSCTTASATAKASPRSQAVPSLRSHLRSALRPASVFRVPRCRGRRCRDSFPPSGPNNNPNPNPCRRPRQSARSPAPISDHSGQVRSCPSQGRFARIPRRPSRPRWPGVRRFR